MFARLLSALLLNLLFLGAVQIDDFAAHSYDPDNDPATHNLPYRLFTPANYDPAKSYPLIVYLHGLGSGNGDNLQQMVNHAHGAMYFAEDEQQAYQPCFVLVPQEPGTTSAHWHSQPVKGLLDGLMDQMPIDYSIDTDRIYIGGVSMGGNGAWNQITSNPNRYAAAFPISGAGGTGSANKITHLPMWLWHAADDTVVNVNRSRDRANALRNLGASVIYSEWNLGGHVISPALCSKSEFYAWLMAQRKGSTPMQAPFLRITEYAVGDTLSMSGSCGDSLLAVSAVDWSNAAGGSGTAAGTDSWSFSGAALTAGDNLINVTATGAPYKDGDSGNTTVNQALTINWSAPAGEGMPPSLSLASPAHTDYQLETELAQLNFSGTASDETALSQVRWQSDRGHSGTATGTTSWSALVDLELGLNRVHLTAEDSGGNTHTRIVDVIRTGVIANEAPIVRAGPDILLSAPDNTTSLDASLGDDGLPAAASLQWSMVSGPGAVDFADATAMDTDASFSQVGTYVLRLSADDGEFISSDDVTVEITAGPVAVAGPGVLGINIRGSQYTASDGTVYEPSDNYSLGSSNYTTTDAIANTPDPTLYQSGHFPHGSILYFLPVPNGEYIVTLKTHAAINALGSSIGDYFVEGYRVLDDLDVRAHVPMDTAFDHSVRVQVTDGELEVRMAVVKYKPLLNAILVQQAAPAASNTAPSVEAGGDQTIRLDGSVSLSGSIVDDGMLPGSLTPTAQWSVVSGPGSVNFVDATAASTTATFTQEGTYVLQLEGSDTIFSSTDTLSVTVDPIPPRQFLFDFGTSGAVPTGFWNTVSDHTDGSYLAIDSEGNATTVSLTIAAGFLNKDTTGPSGTGLYPDKATDDSFYTSKWREGQVLLGGLNPAATYTLTIFSSAAFDAANDGGSEFTVNGNLQVVNATDNTTTLITFADVAPDASGEILIGITATDDVGETFINVLEVQESLPTTSGYAAWIDTYYTGVSDAGIVGELADPDGDGQNNLIEYALGSDPSQHGERVAIQADVQDVSGQDHLALSYERNTAASELTFSFEQSDDLSSWTAATVITVSNVPHASKAGIEVVTVRSDTALSAGARYLRLKVSQ